MSRSSTDAPGERRLRIGRVGRPHGTRGSFSVSDPTRRPRLLDAGLEVEIAGSQTRIVAREGTDDRPVIAVEGVQDREAARRLAGAEITVARAQIGGLEPGEHLVDDLVGLAVVDGSRAVGRVTDVLLLPSADVLDVERADGSQLLVPMIPDAIRSIGPGGVDIKLDFLGEA